VVMMIMYISYDGYVYLANRITESLPNNSQLKFDKAHHVNRITVISGVRVLLKCFLKIVWKSPGNLFGWICRHPVIRIELKHWSKIDYYHY